jgi:hypothetical protein
MRSDCRGRGDPRARCEARHRDTTGSPKKNLSRSLDRRIAAPIFSRQIRPAALTRPAGCAVPRETSGSPRTGRPRSSRSSARPARADAPGRREHAPDSERVFERSGAMRKRTAFALWLSLAAVGCSGSATPTQPTSLPSSVATISSGSVSTAPAAAQPTPQSGNSGAAHLCYKDGYRNRVRTDGTGFSNVGDCVSYAAQGGAFGTGLIIYSLSVSGTVIGDFGWSLATTGFITTTTSFNSFLSTSSSAGCTISSVTINNPSSPSPFVETFFSPPCSGGGLLFSEVAQTFWDAGPFASTGVYSPQGVVTPPVWTLTVTQP